MKKIYNILSLVSLLVCFQVALPGKHHKVPPATGYLKSSLPPDLIFGIDALPADRLMLITKAPKVIKTSLDLTTILETNATVTTLPDEPVVTKETIDPPDASSGSTLSVNPSLSVVAGDSPFATSGVVVTTDELLQLLELENKSNFKTTPRVIVPFEMPHSQTPAAPVLNSKARYIKRWK